MKIQGAVPTLMLAAVLALAGCSRESAPPPSSTAVLGGYGPGQQARESAAGSLADASGRAIPAPVAPATAKVQAVRSGEDAALALWVQDGHVMASSWTPATGWTVARPLEEIYGEASDPQVASNGRGKAMALWRHTVGSIQSLRFSRFEQGSGWSPPDVLPGALPRPDANAGSQDAPRLQMDAAGNVVAEWASGFQANEMQTARYVDGEGWTRAASEPVASAPSASPPPPAASSAR